MHRFVLLAYPPLNLSLITKIMNIRITKQNNKKIEEALLATNCSAVSFTLRSYCEVCMIEERAAKRLCALTQKDQIGAAVTFTPAGPSARAYKYSAVSTRITLVRRASGWFLTNIEKCEVRPKQSENLKIIISEEQAKLISEKTLSKFIII